MTDVLVRSVAAPLEVVGDGRTVIGLVAPYGQVATVNDGFGDYRETIDKGAFAKVMRARPQFVRLHLEHPGQWVGRGERWLDADDGLHMSFRVDDTEDGRTAVYKVRDGQTPGLSLAFIPGRTITKMGPDGAVEHRATVKSIHHVALCQRAAYPAAEVTAVRSADHHPSVDRVAAWRRWLDAQAQ